MSLTLKVLIVSRNPLFPSLALPKWQMGEIIYCQSYLSISTGRN